jgi:hypothetical protein
VNSSEPIPYRPLGLIVSMLESVGFQMTHCYDDLLFVEHNAFLLQMGEKGEDVGIWFNEESEVGKRSAIFDALHSQSPAYGLQLTNKGLYKLVPNEEDETLQIEFM